MNVSNLKLPSITYPFPEEISPYANKVQQWTVDWGERLNILPVNSFIYENFEKIKSGYLSARAHPHAAFSDLILLSDHCLLTFVLDDYCEQVTDVMEFKGYLEAIMQILKGKAVHVPEEDRYLFGWNDWWTRVKDVTHPEWQKRFIDDTEKYLEAQIWEVNNRNNNQVPRVEDYIMNRQHTGGVFPCFDLIEAVDRIYLPPEARNRIVIELTKAANNLIVWSNDMMSLQKEVVVGEVHNLIVVLQHQRQISLQAALDQAAEMHEVEVEKYLNLERKLFEQKSPYREELEAYTLGLRSWIRGNLDWSIESERYQFTNQ